MCHLVLLMPLAGLPLFWLLPFGYALPINALIWVASAFLFHRVTVAMREPPQDGFKSLVGTDAEVISATGPKYSPTRYLVKAGGELWTARSGHALQPGERANIVAVDGISLVVEQRDGHPQSDLAAGQTGVRDERNSH